MKKDSRERCVLEYGVYRGRSEPKVERDHGTGCSALFGVTRSFKEQADLLINIRYGRSFQHSLGTAASAEVIGFEVLRQRIPNITSS